MAQASQQATELQASFGSFVSNAAGFDAAAFGLPEAEALLMDPQQRLLLEVSWESLGSAMSAEGAAAGSGAAAAFRAACGVFVGVSSRDYFTLGKEYSQVCRTAGTGNACVHAHAHQPFSAQSAS